MSDHEKRIELERRIARKVVKGILDLGYHVAVFDHTDREMLCGYTRDAKKALNHILSVDEVGLSIAPIMGNSFISVGNVLLINGNSEDMIADYTDVDAVRMSLRPAQQYIEGLTLD